LLFIKLLLSCEWTVCLACVFFKLHTTPPLTQTNSRHSGTGAMAAVTVGGISQEAIGDFW